jgi:transcription elongation factor GreA
MQTVPMTAIGAERLKAELQQLKTIERPRIIQAISDARANGDLKENADYHAARDQQSFIEGRIIELESKLSNCQVIDVSKIDNEGKVIFGATVTVLLVSNEKQVTYQIVGDEESDLKNNKISISSPIARGLIGKYEGDTVDVTTPSGIVQYEIEKVEYI